MTKKFKEFFKKVSTTTPHTAEEWAKQLSSYVAYDDEQHVPVDIGRKVLAILKPKAQYCHKDDNEYVLGVGEFTVYIILGTHAASLQNERDDNY